MRKCALWWNNYAKRCTCWRRTYTRAFFLAETLFQKGGLRDRACSGTRESIHANCSGDARSASIQNSSYTYLWRRQGGGEGACPQQCYQMVLPNTLGATTWVFRGCERGPSCRVRGTTEKEEQCICCRVGYVAFVHEPFFAGKGR